MKKTKIIASAIALSMMCMGAAYAWTNPISISVAADTAVFSVDIVGAETLASPLVDNLLSTISGDKKSMSFTAENLYPGASGETRFYVTNTGTIDVKLSDMLLESADFGGIAELGSNVEVEVKPISSQGTDPNQGPMVTNGWGSAILLNSHNKSFFANNPLYEVRTVIHPGQTAKIDVIIKLNASAPDTTTEGKKVSFIVVPVFEIAK
ncbi:hypothetical protein [Clostridium sp.]|uniref:hypothetical protein n=1 Tax=Clostridium sp. TaxID=1506 RepID=UPI003D6D3536